VEVDSDNEGEGKTSNEYVKLMMEDDLWAYRVKKEDNDQVMKDEIINNEDGSMLPEKPN